LILVAGILAGLLWYYNRPAKVPPQVDLSDAETPVKNAIELARKKVLSAPRSGDTWGFYGKVLLANGYEDAATECFTEAQRLDPKNPRWPYFRALNALRGNMVSKPQEALGLLRLAVELTEDFDPEEHNPRLALAELLVELDQPEEAKEHFRAVQEKDPDHPRLLFNLGLQAFQENRFEAAIAYLEQVASNPATRPKALALLPQAYRRQGNTAKAERLAKELHKQFQGWEDKLYGEVSSLVVGSRKEFGKVEELGRENKMGEVNALLNGVELPAEKKDRVRVTNLMNWGKYEEAQTLLRKQLRSGNQGNFRTHFALCAALFLQGNSILKTRPAQRDLALTKIRESIEVANDALKIIPNEPLTHYYLGRARLHLGQQKEGINALKLVVNVKPGLPEPHLYLGLALADADQDEEALKELELAARFGKGDKEIAKAIAQALDNHKQKLAKNKPGRGR
jgi:tetratricopeptide (TPR) repeat protein